MRLLREYIKEILGVARARKSIKEICGVPSADIDDAMATANLAHLRQKRRSGEAYIEHPIAVANIIYRFYPDDQTLCGIALLHDTMEDAIKLGNVRDAHEMASMISASFGDPEAGFEALETVKALTHEKSVNYNDYVIQLTNNPDALKIKLADMLHNLQSSPSEKQIVKYTDALRMLKDYFGGKPSGINASHWRELLKFLEPTGMVESQPKNFRLTRDCIRHLISEVTELPKEYYTDIDNAISDSKFWQEDNSSDEVLIRKNQPQTDAAEKLQGALRKIAKTIGLDTIFYVESPVDAFSQGLELGPDHLANKSEWLYNANMVISEPSGRKKLTLDMMTLGDDYEMSELDLNHLIRHIGTTVRHELIHKKQVKTQMKDRGDASMLATFRKMKLDPKQMPDEESPKYKDTETGEWLPQGRQRYFKDYLRAHIETDAYAHEAAEWLAGNLGYEEALDVLRKPVNPGDARLPTALTKYAEMGDRVVLTKVKGKIYKYLQSFRERGLREYIYHVIHPSMRVFK